MDDRDADFSKLDVEKEAQGAQGSSDDSDSAGAASLKKELEELKDKYLRALADQENARKRALKDRADLLKYQGEKIFLDFLPVLDNFELALQHSASSPEQLKAGLELIYKMFVEVLNRWEVRGESSIGKEFDPVSHSAISKVPSSEHKTGSIISELRKVYFYKDKLLLPGEVVVAVEPLANSEVDSGSEDAAKK